jgi:hypothetical protein
MIIMGSGGARNRSGPPADEKSARSDRRGYSLSALPATGYTGPIPSWPLTEQSDREAEVWEWAWRTPQAWAWSQPSEKWRARSVAMWVRVAVRCEAPDVGAALLTLLPRYASDVGMTTAGLAEMGWKVAVDQVGAKRAETVKRTSSRDRMKIVAGEAG